MAKKPSTTGTGSTRASRAARGSAKIKPEAAIGGIVLRLDGVFPNPKCELDWHTPFELLVAVILSAQCTDKRVNMTTPALFARYPTPDALAAAPMADVEALVKSTGFFRNKAKNIVGCALGIVERFGGMVPRTMEELLTLPGVARKTANVVLGECFGIASGVVVDTHVMRLTRLLGLTAATDPKKIEIELMALLPKERWIKFSHQLILHGRRTCIALRPRCGECALADLCPSAS